MFVKADAVGLSSFVDTAPGALYELSHTAVAQNYDMKCEEHLPTSQKWSNDYLSRYVHLILLGGSFMD